MMFFSRPRFLRSAIFLLFSFQLLSCVNPSTGTSIVAPNQGSGDSGSGTSSGTPPVAPPAYTGQVTTIAWQNDGAGFTQFFTNDSSYIHTNGWSEWTWDSTVEQPMVASETQVEKISGDPTMGFGVTFCVQDADNFYVLYIDVTGWYSIGKVVSGTYTAIQAWTDADVSSTVLNQGYGYRGANNIQITRSASNRQFTVTFNGTPTTTFSDATFTGGAYGFVVGISADESFPTQPVDVRFKQIMPVP